MDNFAVFAVKKSGESSVSNVHELRVEQSWPRIGLKKSRNWGLESRAVDAVNDQS